MTFTSKKFARATIGTPEEDADPLGFAAKLEEAYHVRLRAFLRDALIVRLKPAKLRGVVDAGTIQGGPVSFPLTITVYPRDASGFARVVGELETADLPLDFSSIDPADGPFLTSLFTEKPVRPPVRPKRPPGKRKRKLRPWTGRPFSMFEK